jgi:hypothetical protein
MQRILLLACGVLCAFSPLVASEPAAPDPATFDRILKSFVLDNGTVNYGALKAGIEPLSRFVAQIGAVSPDSAPALFPSRAHSLAYWINTYNALVLWAMAKEYPSKKDRLSSVLGRYYFFEGTKFKVGGRERSLRDIENNTIRKQFSEPRIHFAIVCASKGCPWLSRDAFMGDRLDKQLESAARLFVNQERNVRVDSGRREVGLSKIFQWYKQDFGSSTEAVLGFIGKYRPDGGLLRQGKWTAHYFDYNWGINEAQ